MQSRIAIALFALSVLLHWPFGHTDFVYDDVDFVRENLSIRTIGDAFGSLLQPFPPDQPERGLYRPLLTLSYALDFSLFETAPRGYHAVNAVLYGALVWLVYALARAWFGGASATAFAAALLFAVHPVHCDAVDTISGRSELLALGFVVASLLAFLRATSGGDEPPRRAGLALSALLYALGCASKETAVLLPAVLILHLLARDGAPRGLLSFGRRALDLTSGYLGIACLYLALRLFVLGSFGPAQPVLAGVSPLARASTIGSVFAEDLRLLVYPNVLQLDFYYQQAIGIPQTPTLQSVIGWIGIALLAAGFGIAASAALRGRPTSLATVRGGWIAGVGSAFVFLLPVSHLLGIGALMAERFLLAPSLGLIFFGAAVASRGLRSFVRDRKTRRACAAAALAIVALAGSVRSAARAAEWRDGIRLWESLAELTPNDYRLHSNAATHWIERGEYDEAEASLRRALELERRDPAVHANLAFVLMERGELDAAESIHRSLIAANPNDDNAWLNLGLIELRRDRASRALEHFERSLAANPNSEPAKRLAAHARSVVDAARRYVFEQRVRARESTDPELLESYARACRAAGDDSCSDDDSERPRQLQR